LAPSPFFAITHHTSEFSHQGKLLFDAHFPPKVESYRAFRFPWSAQPTDDLALAVEKRTDKKVTLYASWNGATEVATWEVLSGPRPVRVLGIGAPGWLRDGHVGADL
jgi:hypothetical protein